MGQVGQPGSDGHTHIHTNRHQADIAPYHSANCKQVNLTVVYTVRLSAGLAPDTVTVEAPLSSAGWLALGDGDHSHLGSP